MPTMMIAVTIFTLAVSIAYSFDLSQSDQQVFDDFLAYYGKTYSPAELEQRFTYFRETLEFVRVHNTDSTSPFTVALNPTADWSPDELSQRNGFSSSRTKHTQFVDSPTSEWTEDYLDWRYPSMNPANVTAVTKVKDQGNCGSCWAFATCAATEGNVAINSDGILNDLSEQELIDCNTAGQAGCDGGSFPSAFSYMKKNGVSSALDYGYSGTEGSCQADQYSPVSAITDQSALLPCSNSALQNALVNTPVAVGLDAGCKAFQTYESGVFDSSCGTDLNHAVAVVGFGVDSSSGLSYYILKNSWGPEWGESGFMRIKITSGDCGICGILVDPTIPVGGYALTNDSQLLDLDDDYYNDDDSDDANWWAVWGWAIVVGSVCGALVAGFVGVKLFTRYRYAEFDDDGYDEEI